MVEGMAKVNFAEISRITKLGEQVARYCHDLDTIILVKLVAV